MQFSESLKNNQQFRFVYKNGRSYANKYFIMLSALRSSQKKGIRADQEQDRCGLCGKCQRTSHREWRGAVNISTAFHNIRLLRNR